MLSQIQKSCNSNLLQLSKMTDFASEQFITEREERVLLRLVFRSAIPRNETAGTAILILQTIQTFWVILYYKVST